MRALRLARPRRPRFRLFPNSRFPPSPPTGRAGRPRRPRPRGVRVSAHPASPSRVQERPTGIPRRRGRIRDTPSPTLPTTTPSAARGFPRTTRTSRTVVLRITNSTATLKCKRFREITTRCLNGPKRRATKATSARPRRPKNVDVLAGAKSKMTKNRTLPFAPIRPHPLPAKTHWTPARHARCTSALCWIFWKALLNRLKTTGDTHDATTIRSV